MRNKSIPEIKSNTHIKAGMTAEGETMRDAKITDRKEAGLEVMINQGRITKFMTMMIRMIGKT